MFNPAQYQNGDITAPPSIPEPGQKVEEKVQEQPSLQQFNGGGWQQQHPVQDLNHNLTGHWQGYQQQQQPEEVQQQQQQFYHHQQPQYSSVGDGERAGSVVSDVGSSISSSQHRDHYQQQQHDQQYQQQHDQQ